MARVGHALVDVHLATGPFVALETLALERAFGVEAAAAVLTGVGTCHVVKEQIVTRAATRMYGRER